MLTVGKAAEQGGGVIEAETLIEFFAIQHRAPVTQRFQPDAGRQGERGVGAGTRAPVRVSFSLLQGGDSVSVSVAVSRERLLHKAVKDARGHGSGI
jgi:hypothetical protein